MTYQSQANAYVAAKAQSALNSQASGSGGFILRTAGGQGGRLSKGATPSAEVRRDGMSSRGRHGTQKTAGAYEAEMSIGAMDPILEGVMRASFIGADLTLTQADVTSITTGANTIIAASGSWISLGLRVGHVIVLTGHSSSGNNSRNLRIVGLTASTITVAETLTVNAVADTSITITRPGRWLTNGVTKTYYTIEEYEIDIDSSEIFTDCVWSGIRFSMSPNGVLMASPSWVGTGRFETQTTSGAPLLTSPTESTGEPMAVVESTIHLGSGDRVDITGLDLTLGVDVNAPDMAVSHYSPDVFPGNMSISGSITALRADLLDVAAFLAETVLSLSILAVEQESEPKSFFSLFIPNLTLGGVDKSALAKPGGPRTQTLQIPADFVGIDQRGGAYARTMALIQVSNATGGPV